MGLIERNNYRPTRRDYTVVSQQAESETPHIKSLAPDEDSSKYVKTSKFLGPILLVIILAAIGFGGYKIIKNHHPDPIPPQVKAAVTIPLYYPTSEPDGYHLDVPSIKQASGTVFYNLTDGSNHTIIISQQPRPKDFNPKSLFQHNPLPTTSSPLGTIYDLSYKNQSHYMITTPSSLVFISSTAKITNAQLEQIVDGLKISE